MRLVLFEQRPPQLPPRKPRLCLSHRHGNPRIFRRKNHRVRLFIQRGPLPVGGPWRGRARVLCPSVGGVHAAGRAYCQGTGAWPEREHRGQRGAAPACCSAGCRGVGGPYQVLRGSDGSEVLGIADAIQKVATSMQVQSMAQYTSIASNHLGYEINDQRDCT
jgi:hypothetical protein